MSLSRPTETTRNPAEIFIEWHGSKGLPYYYDKQEKQNFEIKVPMRFILLDELSTIKGFSESYQSNIYSNEVRNLSQEPLKVRTFKGGFEINGMYNELKPKIAEVKGKFTRSIYIALHHKGKFTIANMGLSGAAFASWLEFTRANGDKVYGSGIVLTGPSEEKSKGAVKYRVPMFELVKLEKEETIAEATRLDGILQDYLDKYLAVNAKLNNASAIDADVLDTPPDDYNYDVVDKPHDEADDLPF